MLHYNYVSEIFRLSFVARNFLDEFRTVSMTCVLKAAGTNIKCLIVAKINSKNCYPKML